MIVPHMQLRPSTLRAIVLEFVTRDGTDHSIVETRVGQILAQLSAELVELDFDDASQSCNIVLKSHR
ncbi:MAG: cytoplasmic protein [Pirellula sp.]|nr:cytoplasmic protein [Pirellula sp.]